MRRHPDGWTVACGDEETPVRRRLDSAIIEAVLVAEDFAAHAMSATYAAWAREAADRIESNAHD